MIAKNYIKYPEALRFQCEMFSNGYHNSPRIMRLMEVIFDWKPTVPQWFIDQKARAKQLVKAWKSRMLEMFEMLKTKAKKINPRQLELVLFPDAPERTTTKKQILPESNPRFKPYLTEKRKHIQCGGHYRNFCQKCSNWASFTKAREGQYAN